MEKEKDHPATIDDYISQYPQDIQQILSKIRAVIKETAPGAVEKISYGMPAFYQTGNLVWFGVFKRHIGFYPSASGVDASEEEIAPYLGTKGSLHFPLDKPIPYDLIRKIVEYRVSENLKK